MGMRTASAELSGRRPARPSGRQRSGSARARARAVRPGGSGGDRRTRPPIRGGRTRRPSTGRHPTIAAAPVHRGPGTTPGEQVPSCSAHPPAASRCLIVGPRTTAGTEICASPRRAAALRGQPAVGLGTAARAWMVHWPTNWASSSIGIVEPTAAVEVARTGTPRRARRWRAGAGRGRRAPGRRPAPPAPAGPRRATYTSPLSRSTAATALVVALDLEEGEEARRARP